MNFKLIYFITHYLWIFQFILNLLFIVKILFIRKKYKKNSLFFFGGFLITFSIGIELTYGFIVIMVDYVYNTRINGPFNLIPEIIITFSFTISNILLWLHSNWRLTYENDKFVYHNLFFKRKNILFDEIDCSRSFIIKPKDQEFFKIEHYQYIVFYMKNNEKIKVMCDFWLCHSPNDDLIFDIEKFLIKKLKFKVKYLNYKEYKREKHNF